MILVRGQVYVFTGKGRRSLFWVGLPVSRGEKIVSLETKRMEDGHVVLKFMTQSGRFKTGSFYEGDLERFGAEFDGQNA